MDGIHLNLLEEVKLSIKCMLQKLLTSVDIIIRAQLGPLCFLQCKNNMVMAVSSLSIILYAKEFAKVQKKFNKLIRILLSFVIVYVWHKKEH